MSTITNEPILLDSTGQDILTELKNQNSYLAMIAAGSREAVYSSMREIASAVRGNDVDHNKKLFPIGDQIVMPWRDMDDSAHNTDETAYQVAWDIVHHDLVTLRDGSRVPGMFLQMHKASAYGVQFSHQQAFMTCPYGLAAGTYYVTFGATWGSKGASSGTSWRFTLTQAVPAGGRLSGFENLPDQESSAWRVKSWASPASTDPIETVEVASGSGGTNLGTLQYASVGENGLNSMQATGYGSNRWSTSALRQYLNKAGTGWWESQEDFDIRPDQYAKNGFMTGFDEEFLNAVKPVRVTTALNLVGGYDSSTENTFDTFFLPSLQQMNVNPQLANVEGDYFEYWRSRLGMSGYAGTGSGNVFDAFKIPAINANSAQAVRLRSAQRGGAYDTWAANALGYVHNFYHASAAYRFTPVCVVC